MHQFLRTNIHNVTLPEEPPFRMSWDNREVQREMQGGRGEGGGAECERVSSRKLEGSGARSSGKIVKFGSL